MSLFSRKQLIWVFNILIKVGALTACGQNTHFVSVRDTIQPPSTKIGYHTVVKGETLYSIAWRYNLDYKKLAKANAIDRDFKIYPGQRLRLVEYVTPAKASPKAAPPVVKAPPKAPKVKIPRSKKETPKAINKTITKNLANSAAWVWPSRGKLLAGFRSNNGLNMGIDIRGNLGEPVIAAAPGTVVYSGAGLRGYGKLVIIKHNEKYLSAYAHNSRLLVKEGVTVTRGQKIAEMGSTGTDSVKLHFEIRYDGRPVDPLKYLPKR